MGVIIDQHLKWDIHINKLANHVRKFIRTFYTLREILGKKILESVYKALVESLLRYGLVIWGGAYKTYLKQLAVAQNYILKIILRKNRLYPTELLYSSEVLDIRSLYVLCTCSFVHKNIELRNYVNHTYDTRNKINRQLSIPISNTNINMKFLNYLAPKIYNIIPAWLKSITNLKKFNRECAVYITEHVGEFMRLF